MTHETVEVGAQTEYDWALVNFGTIRAVLAGLKYRLRNALEEAVAENATDGKTLSTIFEYLFLVQNGEGTIENLSGVLISEEIRRGIILKN